MPRRNQFSCSTMFRSSYYFKLLLFTFIIILKRSDACIACLSSSVALHQHRGSSKIFLSPMLLWRTLHLITEQGCIFNKDRITFLSDNIENNKEQDGKEDASSEAPDASSVAMIASIGFYKKWISPLLPPACRFLPTCSQYGVQAIERYGPTKGAILTAWRLLRCSPFGGKGYDPPKWPPVPYNYGSY